MKGCDFSELHEIITLNLQTECCISISPNSIVACLVPHFTKHNSLYVLGIWTEFWAYASDLAKARFFKEAYSACRHCCLAWHPKHKL